MGLPRNFHSLSELRALLRDLGDARPAGRLQSPSDCLAFLLGEIYGDEQVRRTKIEQLQHQCESFAHSFGDGPVQVLRVPARINVLGEHVDYVSYLPTASLTLGSREHDMVLVFRRSEEARIRGRSTLAGSGDVSIDLTEAPSQGSGREWESYLYGRTAPPAHWGNYVRGAAFYACMRFGTAVRRGFDFVVDSSIPPAGGASSSSALTVLAGAALRSTNGIRSNPAELALDSARAEWFIGTRGGSMDHTTMCVARRAHAVHISYADDRLNLVSMDFPEVRWLTFYSHPADKSKELMLEYNERAAVSRIIIPALIEGWARQEPNRHARWAAAANTFRLGSVEELKTLEGMAQLLPETITFAGLEQSHSKAFSECRMAFPALVKDRPVKPFKVRDRALHHIGEAGRVAAAAGALRSVAGTDDPQSRMSVLRHLGHLLDESHESLRDLYGVSTPAVEQLVDILAGDADVYGARLMGGGFGGNVLALAGAARSDPVIERAQELFYGPRGRDSRAEHAIMVSTPGDGLSSLDFTGAVRAAVSNLNRAWRDAELNRPAVCRLLDELEDGADEAEVWPIVVAAGKGSRARASGMAVPKPLVPVAGVPSVLRVIQAVYANHFTLHPPVVIASPETEPALRDLLRGAECHIVIQPTALGTGDAVLCAADTMKGFEGRALVVWGTQPVIQPRTVARTVRLASIYPAYEMVLPTAVVTHPYAPLLRDKHGAVSASRETHLEQAHAPDSGETNIGVFVAWSSTMFEALAELKLAFWRDSEGRYDRRGGELGFPNELITILSRRPFGVLAAPIADPREEQGVKTLQDIAACERYIKELSVLDDPQGGE